MATDAKIVEAARRLWCAHVGLATARDWAKWRAEMVRSAPADSHEMQDALGQHRRAEASLVDAERELDAAEKALRDIAQQG